jgi:pSer/pThr/pTyr-binding forkhead associated (FHA) protein
MFWMSYAIDAIFLDKNARVVGLVQEIKPWRASKVFLHATACVELPAGTIARSDTRIGDTLITQVLPLPNQSKGAFLLDLSSNARFEVVGSECTVGSDIGNGLQYDLDKSLSPKHFVIKAENGKYTIEDNASRHGTFVNSERIGRATEIKNGDIIKAGITLFLFELF